MKLIVVKDLRMCMKEVNSGPKISREIIQEG